MWSVARSPVLSSDDGAHSSQNRRATTSDACMICERCAVTLCVLMLSPDWRSSDDPPLHIIVCARLVTITASWWAITTGSQRLPTRLTPRLTDLRRGAAAVCRWCDAPIACYERVAYCRVSPGGACERLRGASEKEEMA